MIRYNTAPQRDRNIIITEKALNGTKLSLIADQYDISVARVREIIFNTCRSANLVAYKAAIRRTDTLPLTALRAARDKFDYQLTSAKSQ